MNSSLRDLRVAGMLVRTQASAVSHAPNQAFQPLPSIAGSAAISMMGAWVVREIARQMDRLTDCLRCMIGSIELE